jgi:hypothetical protein
VNLQKLRWTKNVKPVNQEPRAYETFKVGNLFKLAWKDDEGNASRPQREDLILLRQGGYVTHLVEVLDYKPEREKWQVISISTESLKCFGSLIGTIPPILQERMEYLLIQSGCEGAM